VSNPVVHWQLITRDPESTSRFYAELFDWKISAQNQLGYRTVQTGTGKGIDGGIWPAPPNGSEIVQLYVEVEDIDSMLARLEQLGGRVLMPKQMLPDGDAMALALDPAGRPFGLMTSAGK
jgi:predicted enzyme related to lactoylglutathione lyase